MPPARQYPLTAAITGFQTSRPRLRIMFFCVEPEVRPLAALGISDLRSAPAVNARSPAPVMTAIHTSGLSRTSSHALESCAYTSASIAFMTSGRLSVMRATLSRTS